MPKLLIATTVASTLKAFLLPYANHFRKLGWQVDCMSNGCEYDDVCNEYFNQCFNMEWTRYPLSFVNLKICPSKIREIVQQEKYDIVHVHTPVASFVTRFALKNLKKTIGTKVIYTVHGFHFYKDGNKLKNFIFKTLEKTASKWTDKIMVMNEEDFLSAKEFYLSEKVIKTDGIGLDIEYYNSAKITKSKEENYKELGLQLDDKLFLSVAEFIPRKRHMDLLKALSILNDKKIHLAFIGDGQSVKEIIEMAKKMNISNNVHFLGFQQDIRPYIKHSTALLLASIHEGLPRSVMESMSMGIPVIASDIRGNRDLLCDNCGLFFAVGNYEEIAKAMVYCLYEKNRPYVEEMVENAKKKIESYDIKKIIANHEEIYSELLSQKTDSF